MLDLRNGAMGLRASGAASTHDGTIASERKVAHSKPPMCWALADLAPSPGVAFDGPRDSMDGRLRTPLGRAMDKGTHRLNRMRAAWLASLLWVLGTGAQAEGVALGGIGRDGESSIDDSDKAYVVISVFGQGAEAPNSNALAIGGGGDHGNVTLKNVKPQDVTYFSGGRAGRGANASASAATAIGGGGHGGHVSMVNSTATTFVFAGNGGRGASASAAGATAIGGGGDGADGINSPPASDGRQYLGDGGAGASASAVGATAIGSGGHGAADAEGDDGGAGGAGAQASGVGAVALGAGADASGKTSGGAGAIASGQGAVAIGSASGATAGANASALGGVALGAGSQVETSATGSVALGQGAVVTRPHTVSVGSNSQQRVITQVGQGLVAQGSTDAVTGGQLHGLQQATTTAIDSVQTQLTQTSGQASAAQASAVKAEQTATSALGAAKDAQTTATQAVGQADVASRTANSAKNIAQTASTQAAAADSRALSAQQSAAAASQAASAAQTVAQAASGRAVAAQSSAQEAQQTATAASQTAAGAQRDAGKALGLAENSAQYSEDGRVLQLRTQQGAGTVISHLADARVDSDAANLGQVRRMGQSTLDQAQNYTGQQVAALQSLMNSALQNGLCSFSGGNVSCGPQAIAQGTGAVALGHKAEAVGDGTTALGTGAQARFEGSVAVGAGARALADPTTAVGHHALAAGNNSVALGANTQALGHNSVALGTGSVAARDNTVSVGHSAGGLTRQITDVAAGVAPSDAVNVRQLHQTVDRANARAQDYAARGVAAALAVPQVPQLPPGKQWVGAALGNYDGANALGLAWAYQLSEGLNLGVGVSGATRSGGSGRQIGSRVQVGYAW